MLQTRVTELFQIRYPIVQGGLAYLATAELCAAVSNAGGLGQITAATLGGPENLRREIRKTRELTSNPFAVNFAIGLHGDLTPLIEVAIEEKVKAISITGGNPEPIINLVKQTDMKILVLTAGVRAAQKAESLGADAVIAVGFDGGGHLGRDDLGTMSLIPRVVDSVKIPVLASGGIMDGRGLIAALALGAEGIEMGTRFIAVQESPAHENYKQALLNASERDTIIVKRSIGKPARVLNTQGAAKITQAENEADEASLIQRVSGKVNRQAARDGDLNEGFVYAGQGVGLITDIPSTDELFKRIIEEATQIQERLCQGGPNAK